MIRTLKRLNAAVIIAITACTQMEVIPQTASGGEAKLEIDVVTEEHTKGIITGNTLPTGSMIALMVYGPDGNRYPNVKQNQIGYTAVDYPAGQIWESTVDIMLNETEGTLYAYYPASGSTTDMKKIYIKANSSYQDDIMYATPCTGLNVNNSHAKIKMNHALCVVRLSVSRGSYNGPGEIKSLGVGGYCGGSTGYLDATTGKISDISMGTIVSPTTPFILSDEPNIQDVLLIPLGEPGEMILRMKVDGTQYELRGVDILLEQGKITTLNIKVDQGKLSLTSVKVSTWYAYNKGSYSLPTDFNVEIGGNTEGLSFLSSIADNGDVTITAVPYQSTSAEVNPVTVNGEATVTQSLDEITGNRTITLSGMKSDCTVTFNGTTQWLVAEYNVTSTTSATTLYSNGYNPKFTRMKIDGEEMTTSATFLFGTTGTHTVKFALSDPVKVPVGAFHSTYSMTSIKIPDCVTIVDYWSFGSCTQLKSVIFPKGLKTLGWESFRGCQSLESAYLPDGCTIGYGAFSSCKALTDVRLPSDLKNIPNSLFYYCTSLTQVDIPSTVTSIGYRAFNGSNITSLRIPDGVTVLDEEVLAACTKLKELWLPSGLTKIMRQALQYCSALEQITFSDGTVCTDNFIIPDGVTYIGKAALDTRTFKSITIPASLTSADPGGFASSTNEQFIMSGQNPTFDLRNNAVIETATNKLVGGCVGSTKIHESVTSIGDLAFLNSEIASVDIPASVTAIGTQAFVSARPMEIISRALTPPTLSTESFWVASYNGTLKVPAEALDAYRSAWMKTGSGELGWPAGRWKIQALADGE